MNFQLFQIIQFNLNGSSAGLNEIQIYSNELLFFSGKMCRPDINRLQFVVETPKKRSVSSGAGSACADAAIDGQGGT